MAVISTLKMLQDLSTRFQGFRRWFLVDPSSEDLAVLYDLWLVGGKPFSDMHPHIFARSRVWEVGALSKKGTIEEDGFLVVIDCIGWLEVVAAEYGESVSCRKGSGGDWREAEWCAE